MKPFSSMPESALANYSIRNDPEFRLSEKPCIEVMCGSVLACLRVISDYEWVHLEPCTRPGVAVYAEGLGYVAAVQSHVMN